MKRRILNVVLSVVALMMAVSTPILADNRKIDNFDFKTVVYDWKWSTNYTKPALEKANTSSGVVNTANTSGNDGGVKPRCSFNAELVMIDPRDSTTKVRLGHYWGCSPYSRQTIPYSDTSGTYAKGKKIYMGLSLREEGKTAQIWGSWSPDSQ